MAITINTFPALINAAWHPIIYEVSSDRYDSNPVSVTGVTAGTGSFARYAVASHTYKVGDVVTGSGFTGAQAGYLNDRQTVTAVSALYFETDLYFPFTATTGTMTRTNDNFQIKCETVIFDSIKKTISNSGNNGGFQSVTTSTNHGYAVGDIVYCEGTTSGFFDGVYVVKSITNSTTFVLELAFAGTSLVGSVRLGRVIGTKRQSAITLSGSTQFRVNPNGHLQSVLEPYIVDNAGSSLETSSNNAIKLFSIKFTEEFDDKDGLMKEVDYKLSSRSTGVRAVLQRENGVNINTVYVDTTIKFLTKAPNNKKIRIGEEEQLSFLYTGTDQLRAGITKYNLAGVVQPEIYTTLKTINDYRAVLPINSHHFDNTVSKFDIWLVDNVPNGRSELKTFIVDYNNYQNPIRIYFENTLGGFDAYTFTARYSELNKTKRTEFKKSTPIAYSLKDRGIQNIAIQGEKTYEVYSEYLNKEYSRWLEELIITSNAYIKQIGDTVFTPIVILTDSNIIYDSNGLSQIKLVYQKATNILTIGN